MKIGEIAKAAGVSTSRIRFYEKRGIIPEAARDANGYRDYPPSLIARLRLIDQAQHLGFTLKEVSAIDPQEGEHPVSCARAIELLTAKLDSIDVLIAEAEERKRNIQAQIEVLRKPPI